MRFFSQQAEKNTKQEDLTFRSPLNEDIQEQT